MKGFSRGVGVGEGRGKKGKERRVARIGLFLLEPSCEDLKASIITDRGINRPNCQRDEDRKKVTRQTRQNSAFLVFSLRSLASMKSGSSNALMLHSRDSHTASISSKVSGKQISGKNARKGRAFPRQQVPGSTSTSSFPSSCSFHSCLPPCFSPNYHCLETRNLQLSTMGLFTHSPPQPVSSLRRSFFESNGRGPTRLMLGLRLLSSLRAEETSRPSELQ